MKTTRTRRGAGCTRALLGAALLCSGLLAGPLAWAGQVAGTIVHLSGPLLDRKADGTVKVLGLKSEVESGDTLVAEKDTYAQIRFIDNGEITLKPGTTFRIENFAYDAGKPEEDSAAFNLIKGGLRSITGLLGHRSKQKFSLKTPSATIGVRGTNFIAQFVPPPEPEVPLAGAVPPGTPPGRPAAPALAPGLHVEVTEGAIVVTNAGGSTGFVAGQFGFVPSVNQPPIIVPQNPGLHFTPPPSFGSTGAPPAGPLAGNGSSQDPAKTDCVVR